ncbi:DivIVA domain-containing protein [Amycolatopsis suaedae]|uniref:Cell wall synthesis protein Wag31 n=1 Tax=Amycolatopsis suaedae TaxID=2510978 RepID=A0A4Q7J974_9PSEU|nr:DivIVA domain-containing protein [Amycolatopsis suaedae]RZQ63476.1 DivIVA domain-containing protein [Amycolatopsis suaedae]
MSLTAEDAERVEFGTAPIGRRGYAKPEVDEFVRRIVKTLNGEDDLTAAEVHHVMFARPIIGRRGYDERDVDEFLDSVENELLARTGVDRRAHQVPQARGQGETGAFPTKRAVDSQPEQFQEQQ